MTDDKPTAPPGAISAEPMALPPIPLNPPPAARPTTAKPSVPAKKEPEHKDSYRELIETVVFVVVLVLMLKTFLAEAFVIPTGSMADTLLGYHHKVTCQQCGYPNLVNASSEAEPPGGGDPVRVESCQCVNCGFTNVLARPKEDQGGKR
jgi:predicted nucleic-acid-binding Zn-ribbon protein